MKAFLCKFIAKKGVRKPHTDGALILRLQEATLPSGGPLVAHSPDEAPFGVRGPRLT